MKRILATLLGVAIAVSSQPAAAAGATLKGTVFFKGKAPEATRILITKDQETCGEGKRIVDEVRVGKGNILEDVAVFVDGKIDGLPPPKQYELLQKGCRFNPFVSAVQKGAELKIVNGDPVAHNIHAYELIGRARRDLFNFQQPKQGHTKTKKIKVRRGNIVQLQCDIHDFMRGWIVVPQNPFATVVSAGKYTLEGIPAGERTIMAFHPVLGIVEKKITLTDGGNQTLDFEFTAK